MNETIVNLAKLLCRLETGRNLGYGPEPMDPEDRAAIDGIVNSRWEEWIPDSSRVLALVIPELFKSCKDLTAIFGRDGSGAEPLVMKGRGPTEVSS